MGRVTEENKRELERALHFGDAKLTGMVSNTFPVVLGRLIQKKNISVMRIVENTSISKTYVNKLRNATLEETNSLLKAARYQELYTRDAAEAVIIWGLIHKQSGAEIRRELQEKGYGGFFK